MMSTTAPHEPDHSPRPDASTRRRATLICVAIFVAALLPYLATPVLPVIDFYNHLSRYFVLSHLDGDNALRHFYQSNWSVLPNIGMDVIGVGLVKFLPAGLAAKVIYGLIFANLYFALISFNRRLTGGTGVLTALLTVPLLYSYIFVWGFANFQLGLGLMFWGASWWLATRGRLMLATPVASLIAVAIFFAHGIAFALYGLLVGALEIGFFLFSSDRKVVDAAKRLAALALQAVIPALLFISTTTAKSQYGITKADESIRHLAETGGLSQRLSEIFFYRLQTIVRVAESPSLVFDVVTLVLTVAVLGALAWRGRVTLARAAWPAIAIAAVLVVVTPPGLFGVGYVADRMPLFLALILVGSLAPRFQGDRLERLLLIALAAMVAGRIAYIGVDWLKYRKDFADFQTVARQIPPASLAVGVNVTLEKHVSAAPRCEMYGPLLISMYGQVAPMFANSTQQPIRLVGRLREAVDAEPTAEGLSAADAPRFWSDYMAAADKAGLYRYLLICGAERLNAPFPADSKVVGRAGRFTLLKLHAR